MLAVVAFVSCLLFISVAKLVSGKTALPLVVKAQHEGANNVVVEAAECAGILNGETSEVVPGSFWKKLLQNLRLVLQ